MKSSAAPLLDAALALTEDDRAEMAMRLLDSLDEEVSDVDAESAWETEIERRVSALRTGEVTLIPATDSLARIRKAIRR